MSVRVAFAGSGDAFTHMSDEMLARLPKIQNWKRPPTAG